MYNLNNLTIVIVTFLTDKKTLLNCLNSIDKKVNVILVENSTKFKNQHFFLNRFKNLKIYCSGKNLGYGGGNNFGLRKVKTNYALILNPDTILDKYFFKNLKPLLNNKSFSVIGCELIDNKSYTTGGFFNEKKNQIFRKNFFRNKRKNLTKVDWVTGSSMLLNLFKIKKKNIFDENFFLYFEEFDFCHFLKKKNSLVYLCKSLKIYHLGFKSSNLKIHDFTKEAEKLRNWHWMWSQFYYYRKNYGFVYAFLKSIGKLFKSLFKTLIYFLVFDRNNMNKYLYRSLGLVSSMIGSKSSYRGKFFN
jgi:GT2 family glycosyltransferase